TVVEGEPLAFLGAGAAGTLTGVIGTTRGIGTTGGIGTTSSSSNH
ncbi:hypothetical protein Tco_0541998, partial [Tanacetum coccineum]